MDTISTSEPEKLPAEVRGLLVETQPLPPGVAFYEERFTTATMFKNVVWGLGLMGAGIVCVPFGFYELFAPRNNSAVYDNHNVEWWIIGFGFVAGLFGWTMLASVPVCLAARRRQRAGERTRYGLFLTPEALIYRNFSDTTVIPCRNLRGLENSKVNYVSEVGRPGPKSFTLSHDWIGVQWLEVERAIQTWIGQNVDAPPGRPL